CGRSRARSLLAVRVVGWVIGESSDHSSVRDGLDLAEACQPSQGLDLDLTHALAGQAETTADLLERLRLVVVETVAQSENLAPALVESGEGRLQRLAPERELDLLVRQWPFTGDEVAEHRFFLIPDGLVEARRRPGRRTHLAGLLDRQAGFLGDLL